ncbi:MAG: 4-hydroxy-3-methylbut-2-enyl diphosphate reductase [Crocinitomicaceae bacterium]|nr:4-hydroxy-3-methylbut-2-enyl diphosphate reductase [Crocinitomicaceae bacterium]MDG1776848.1 4-hydroxy-3-methylbut-2-enyl diphosphate reductase [Crocinitomicaceae bacterium]
MKKFEIPEYYKSPIISKVKAMRKLEDPRKKDFSPTILKFGSVEFIISRHFGFCYGVENAIEKSYRAIQENPEKRIFLISQMIHNPDVNQDLLSQGVRFIQDTDGSQLISWDEITLEDIVIIPAFGTTTETRNLLTDKGVDVKTYNTTCPFVEKVWNRSAKLGENDHTIIIHGKYNHEETKATFSHSKENSPSLIVKNMEETKFLSDYILGKHSTEEFNAYFKHKYSANFNPELDLAKIGVVNQTTMLASETQEIASFIRTTMIEKFGEEQIKNHFADTKDTLCYATNDNQSATLELLNQEADLAIVVGGYNSSNTSHLVELLEQKFKTFFIKNDEEISSKNTIKSFNIHSKTTTNSTEFLGDKKTLKIIITSGASCPDAIVDNVMKRVLDLMDIPFDPNNIKL